ncbi:NRAMP family divalent metal transporter [Chryseolinea lacunae]|uniref:Divalent metal cation transporter n=1 Tax=Chryseolinea lacunae TaxID=2801331 RepID=A0ABS1KSH7_9BACT|nr:divalent metal cation transporter [Chryseolinea lacunae]MBL0742420.1 divalent metal cation transporter [Chryseolinea lacunae]
MRTVNTWKSVVIWSIISAAFIGPGTVTTAVSAGSIFKLSLLWSVVFATVACIMLQEIAARITIASGLNVGQALKKKFGSRHGATLQWLVGGSVIAGCAAYEAGNIMGAVSGMNLITGMNIKVLTVIISLTSFAVLWIGNPSWISNLMTFLVAVMGVSFLLLAFGQHFSVGEIFTASVVPSIPAGSELLVLGLVGTTVVPYNLFLGSGISKGQTIPFMRVGLAISVFIGGLITAAILVAGTAVVDFSSFPILFAEFEAKSSYLGAVAMALGLFAAGFSSAITSPYASAVIARTVFEMKNENYVKIVWILVLLTGFMFGISGLRPIPVILVVQALNGLILPLLVAFLILVVNDRSIMPDEHRPSVLYNVILLFVLFAVLMISLNNIEKPVATAFNLPGNHLGAMVVITSLVVVAVAWVVFHTDGRTSEEV